MGQSTKNGLTKRQRQGGTSQGAVGVSSGASGPARRMLRQGGFREPKRRQKKIRENESSSTSSDPAGRIRAEEATMPARRTTKLVVKPDHQGQAGMHVAR